MSEHELFKLKKELVQSRKIIEQQKVDLKYREKNLIQIEVQHDEWREKAMFFESMIVKLREELQEKERIIQLDDPLENQKLKTELERFKDIHQNDVNEIRKLQQDLEDREGKLKQNRMTFLELSERYKDPSIIQDSENYRDEITANRLKVQNLVEKHNQMNTVIEQLSAENRVLRKMASVPDDYTFELDDVIQEGQVQVEKYRGQVRVLEEEVEEQQEEIARLRRRLRENAIGIETNTLDEQGEQTKKQLKHEIIDLKTKCKNLEQENYQLKIDATAQSNQRNEGFQGAQGADQQQMSIQMKEYFDSILQKFTQSGQIQQQQQSQLQQQQQQQGDTNNNGIMDISRQQQQYQQQQQGQQHPLSYPPNPLPGAFGSYNDIKEGFSYRFQTKLPVDNTKLYGESGIDFIQLRFEMASLQLQNMETLRLLQEKEKEYYSLANEVDDIKDDMKKKCLLVQDELFQRYLRDKVEWDTKYNDLDQRYKQQQELIVEQKVKLDTFTVYFDALKKNDPEQIQAKFSEMTKRTAILDVNLIKLSRKYDALNEEYNQMKVSHIQQSSDYIEKEREFIQQINDLVGWKRVASVQMKIMLTQLQNSIPMDTFHVTRQELEDSQEKLAEYLFRDTEQINKIAILENAERDLFLKSEQIRNTEEELTEIVLESEILKKRLEALDPAFRKFQQIYGEIVEKIKIKNISPLQMFQQFDKNNDNKLQKEEFSESLKYMGINISREDLDVLYQFVDLDGSGVIEYGEFLRKLRRSGVSVRQKDEQLLYEMNNAIQEAGLNLRTAFEAFDQDGDRQINKQDMKNFFIEAQMNVPQESIDYIFKIADTSRDNTIQYSEFQNLFDTILKNNIQEDKQAQLGELDWKMQVMVNIDAAVKEQNLTLMDAFKMIDDNNDNTISLIEFIHMFESMEIKITRESIKDLFQSINQHKGAEITYNQLLNYLREAKLQEQNLNRLKIIQERTRQLKERVPDDYKNLDQKQQFMTQESRMQMKITILEMRERNAQTRSTLLSQQLAQQDIIIKDYIKQIQDVQQSMEKINKMYHKEHDDKLKLEKQAQGSISKEESQKLKKINDHLHLQNESFKSALNTYRNLYDTAVTQTKTMRLTIEKIKNDHSTLQQTIKDLQGESEQNATIGKLYHNLMISRWHEGQTNQKIEQLHDENRLLKQQQASFDELIKEKSIEIFENNEIFRQQVLSYENQITELKLKCIPTVTLQRIEEQANRIREIADMKFEVEKQNRILRDQFYELQLKADYFDVYKTKLDELEQRLKYEKTDELSVQIIEVSEKYSECKIQQMRLQREIEISKETEEYYHRLNRQYTDTIKKLEFDLSQADLHLRKREEEWRRKFYEQRKSIFASDDQNSVNPSKNSKESQAKLMDYIKKSEQINNKMDKQNDNSDIEITTLKLDKEQLQNDLKKKEIEIEGLMQRLKIQSGGGSQVFTSNQLEAYTRDILAQEAEKLSMAAQQSITTLQDILRDKEAQVERKEKQIEQIKKEAMQHKKRDLDEIQRLNDLLFLRDREKINEKLNIPNNINFNTTLSQAQATPVMLQEYKEKLKEKDEKIKDMQIQLEAEKKSSKKMKEDLVKTLDDKEYLQQELILEQKKNESEKYRKQVETLQKMVNQKNKELQSIKGTVSQLKDEVFKVAQDNVKRENEYNTKETKISINNTELEMKLKNMFNEVKILKQEMRTKHEELDNLKIIEIEQKATITDQKKQIEQLKATLIQGGYRLPNKECQQDEQNIDQSVTNIQKKIEQVQQLQIENTILHKEILFLKGQGIGKNLFDKEGNLQSQIKSVYFSNIDEMFDVIRMYFQTKPKLKILQDLEQYDKNKSRLIPITKFFETLQIIGLKFKSRDQKLLLDYVKQEKGDQCEYYTKFYYKLKNQSDQSSNTTALSEKAQQFAGKH